MPWTGFVEGGFTNMGLLGSSSDIMPGITYANDGDDPRLVGICQDDEVIISSRMVGWTGTKLL